MAFTVLLKRSNVASHIPNTTQLSLGELSINTYDGKLYFVQQQNTTNSVLTISPLPASISLTGGATGSANFSGSNPITISTTVLTANTQSPGDNTTNVATTAFVTNTLGSYLSLNGGSMTGDLNIANTASNANSGSTRFHVDAYTNGALSSRFSVVTTPEPAGGTASVSVDLYGGGGFQVYSNTNANSELWIINLSVDALTGNNLGGNINFVPYNDAGILQPAALKIYRSNGLAVFGNTVTTVTQPLTDSTTNAATTAFVQGQFPVNSNIGTFTSFTVNSKGLITAASNITFTGAVTGTASNNTVVLSLANSISVSNVTVSNHYNSNGTTPSISPGPISTSAAINSSSTDARGQIGFGPGSSAAGMLGTVTFAKAYTSQPWVVVCNSGGNVSGTQSNTLYIPNLFVQNITTTGFSIWTATGGLSVGNGYYVNYIVIG